MHKFVSPLFIPTRLIRHKPWNPKFRLVRKMQPFVQPIDWEQVYLRKFDVAGIDYKSGKDLLRKNGFMTSPLDSALINSYDMSYSSRIFDPYKPKSDEKSSSVIDFAKNQAENIKEKGFSLRNAQKIKKYESTFDRKAFVTSAEIYYKKAHELLSNFPTSLNEITQYVTEACLEDMTDGLYNKTLQWKFLSSIEPPTVVQMRVESEANKENNYGQITVRFHSQQSIALFDRFGRLVFGHPDVPVDVLEYVVYEKHLSSEYGKWRIHGKIKPERKHSL